MQAREMKKFQAERLESHKPRDRELHSCQSENEVLLEGRGEREEEKEEEGIDNLSLAPLLSPSDICRRVTRASQV